MPENSVVTPSPYTVSRAGEPAKGHFFVLDLAHDFEARVAIGKLASNYERQPTPQPQLAEECRQALRDSEPAFQAMIEVKNARLKQTKGKKNDRKDNRD